MRRECNSKIKQDAVKNKNLTFFHRTVLLEEGLIVSTVISTGIFLLDSREHFKLLEFVWLFIFTFVGTRIIQRINGGEPLFREVKFERLKYTGTLDELIFIFSNIGFVLKNKIGKQYIFRSNYIVFRALEQISVKECTGYCLINSPRGIMQRFNICEALKSTNK